MSTFARDDKSQAVIVKVSETDLKNARLRKQKVKSQEKQLDEIQRDIKKILVILSRLDLL